MCMSKKKLIAICTVAFGGGIFLSFLLPLHFLAFIEAAAVVLAGVLLLDNRR